MHIARKASSIYLLIVKITEQKLLLSWRESVADWKSRISTSLHEWINQFLFLRRFIIREGIINWRVQFGFIYNGKINSQGQVLNSTNNSDSMLSNMTKTRPSHYKKKYRKLHHQSLISCVSVSFSVLYHLQSC